MMYQHNGKKTETNFECPCACNKNTASNTVICDVREDRNISNTAGKHKRRDSAADWIDDERQAEKIVTLQPAQQKLQACKLRRQLQLLYAACYNRIRHQCIQSALLSCFARNTANIFNGPSAKRSQGQFIKSEIVHHEATGHQEHFKLHYCASIL